MKKKLSRLIGISTMVAMLSIGSTVYGAAAGSGVTGTDIFAGVILSADKVKIDVDVPTVFSFVVQADTTASNAGNSPTVIGPNAVVTPQTGGGLQIGTTGSARLPMLNRSSLQSGGSGSWTGLRIAVQGTLKDEVSAGFQYNTRLATTGTTSSGEPANTYGLVLRSTDQLGSNFIHRFNRNALGVGVQLDTGISLPAPVVNAADGTATADSEVDIALDIEVGGTNADYTTQGASTKVGTITWSISAAP